MNGQIMYLKISLIFFSIAALLSSCDENASEPRTKNFSGWAICEYLDEQCGIVLHTANSGEIWTRQLDADLFKNVNMQDVTTLNSKTAFVCGYDASNGKGYIFKTGDGGENWEKMSLPDEDAIKSVNCLRSWNEVVIAGCDDGIFLVSSDAGLTWRSRPIMESGEGYTIGGIALDGSNRFIAGANHDNQLTIFSTSDSGENWLSHESKPEKWNAIIDVSWARGSDLVWGSGTWGGNDGCFCYSEDAGKNWTLVDTAGMSHYNAIFAYDENTIFAGADHMNFASSDDGGLTWTKQVLNYNDIWIGGISAVSEKELWVVGSGFDSPQTSTSTILYSSDGGAGWVEQNVPDNLPSIWRVSFAK